MAHVDDIIVLDDDDDDEEKPHCSDRKKPCTLPPNQTNGRKGEGESQNKTQGMSAENSKLFDEFVKYCSGLTGEHPEVITFLERRVSRANPSYLSSIEFRNVLGRCLTRVQSKRSKVYVYINELCTSLKANSQKRKITLRPSTLAVQTTKQEQQQSEEDEEQTEEKEEEPTRKTGSKRQIRYLENLLRIYSREIQKLQEKELSIEEMEEEDSTYIQESRLKRKLIRIFEKLCELKDCPSLTGRVIEQRIPYRGTRYPEVNRRLEKFINGTSGAFPDYGDVLRVIQRANERHGLGLQRKQMQGMAQDAFRELGNLLQERRHLDLVYNFGCHLTDSYKPVSDPAHQNSLLARRLRENRTVALSNIDNVIKKYAAMQDDGEEDERRKKKKESETQCSTHEGKASTTKNRETPSPQSQDSGEDEESEEESETDIEEELKQAQQVSDGEEDEDETPANEDNDRDQKMEIPSSAQAYSSGEEDDEEERDDDIIEDEGEEQMEQETSLPSSPLSGKPETLSTVLEMKLISTENSCCPPTQSPDTPPSLDQAEDNRVHDVGSSSEVTSKVNSGDVQVDGRRNMESDLHCLNNNSTDKESDLTTNVESSTSHNKTDQSHVGSSEDCTVSEDRKSPSVGGSDDHAKPVDKETVSAKSSSSLEVVCVGSSTSADSEVLNVASSCSESTTHVELPCVESSNLDTEASCVESSSGQAQVGAQKSCVGSSMDANAQTDSTSEWSNTQLDNDVPCVESSVNNDSEDSRGSSLVGSSDDSKISEDAELSRVGSSNGIAHVKTEEGTDLKCVGSSVNRHTGDSGKTKTANLLNRKRKRSPPHTLLENGKRTFNGNERNRGDWNNKRTKRDSSPDSANESSNSSSPDMSLEMMVFSSPHKVCTSPSNKCSTSHASTQCDPDEIIVLSD
ncbi:death domain-associated protein 6 [Discoglossus pictus]